MKSTNMLVAKGAISSGILELDDIAPEILLLLAMHPLWEVRAGVASNVSMPLGYCSDPPPGLSPSEWVKWVSRHQVSGLAALALDDEDAVAFAVAGNYSTDDYMLQYLEELHMSPDVREMAHITLRNMYY